MEQAVGTGVSASGGHQSAVRLLLVEDDPGDVLMTRKAFQDYKLRYQLHVVTDGVDAMAFLRREGGYADRPGPDLVSAGPQPVADGRS